MFSGYVRYSPCLTYIPGYTPDEFEEGPAKLAISDLPAEFALSQNYPNPFNPTTQIKFSLPQNSKMTLTIYNILGQKVINLIDKEMEAGEHLVVWEGKDSWGNDVANGIYFYKIVADSFVETRKMVLLR